eukprot:GHVU01216392.1.p1 GENE.GHVU01216392.1~~GHVU01216392.1.p1  ORF type:complete len:160 (+),score=10.70 GHVU01216392.1:108-587(+)
MILLALGAVFVIWFVRWLFHPYFKWRQGLARGDGCPVTDKSGGQELLSNINRPPKYAVSLVVPAYNEEKRLGSCLEATIKHLNSRTDKNFNYEIIIVDDGSTDRTLEVARYVAEQKGLEVVNGQCGSTSKSRLRLIQLENNGGKGRAVKIVRINFKRCG